MKCWICDADATDMGSSPTGEPECTSCSKAMKMFADNDRLEMEDEEE